MEFIADGISNDNMLDLVAYCARVSNSVTPNEHRKTREKLIKYLIKHAHWFLQKW